MMSDLCTELARARAGPGTELHAGEWGGSSWIEQSEQSYLLKTNI